MTPSRPVRALIVTNMYPTPERPEYGRFVLDQVEALERRGDVEIEVFAFPPGLPAYPRAARDLRRRYRGTRFDIVHAHFGLTAWPAIVARKGPVVVTLHGNDLFHPRSNRITRAALPFTALPAAVSREFSENVPGAGTTQTRRGAARRHRHHALPPDPARGGAGSGSAWTPTGPYLLFPHDPARPLKRHDRALEVAGDTPLLTMGRVAPDEVPYWINAANAVLVPSQAEGFGLSVIEAIACGVPAFGTPVGIHPVALHGIEGAYCAPYDRDDWRARLAPDPRRRRPARGRRPPRRALLRRPDGRARSRRLARPAGGARVSSTAPTHRHAR